MCESPRYGKVESFIDEHGEVKKRLRFLSVRDVIARYKDGTIEDYLQVGCGKCLFCRMKHARDWALRCQLEAKMYDSNMFLTLTYDDEHLPEHRIVSKQELTKFLRALRDRYRRLGHVGVRYFACGEYGEKTLRPHYHVLLFNAPVFGDEKFKFKNKLNQNIYTSEILNSVWQKGICSIGAVTLQSAGYVARYALKKSYRNLHDIHGAEFITMSRRPGIGSRYLDENFEHIYEYDEIIIDNGKHMKPPKYFDDRYKRLYCSDEEFSERIAKPRQKRARDVREAKSVVHGLDSLHIDEIERESKKRKFKLLTREL